MKEINIVDKSEWISEKNLYINGSKYCIECCFSRKYRKKASNCADVKERLNIPMSQCGGGYIGHYERR